MATTTEQLIEYLKTLPRETEVQVLEVHSGYGGNYVVERDLDLTGHETFEYTDFTGNQFVKPTDFYFNKKYLLFGER